MLKKFKRINIQHTFKPNNALRQFKLLGLAISLSCAIFVTQNSYSFELPNLGDTASAILTPQEEMQLGRSILNKIRGQIPVSNDSVTTDYIYALGYRLVATHRRQHLPYTFFIVEDNSINAFALPGAMIGVNTGLILAADSESELAGVLAHEIGHVQARHIARFTEHASRVRLTNIAGILAGIILATQSTQAAQGAIAATLAGGTQSMLNFSRENEAEADHIGIQSLAAAGFDPKGMPLFFQKMQQANRYYGSNIPEYLLTHPLTENRLNISLNRATEYPYKQIPDSLQFHLIRARIQVASFSNASDAVSHMAKLLKHGTYRSKTGTEYGYCLALLKQGQYQKAKNGFEKLISEYPNQPLFQLGLAKTQIELDEVSQAKATLKNLLTNHPHNHSATITYADLLIRENHPAQAVPILLQHTNMRANDPETYHMLTQAYTKMGKPVLAHRMEAEFRISIGDFKGAMVHLELAKRSNDLDEIQKKQVFARITEIQKFTDLK